MELRAGSRLKSTVCDTEVIAVKASGDLEVTCGGAPMVDAGAEVGEKGEPAADAADGTQMGKRYVDEAGTIELLCVKPGKGSLSLDGIALRTKDAKTLPSSD